MIFIDNSLKLDGGIKHRPVLRETIFNVVVVGVVVVYLNQLNHSLHLQQLSGTRFFFFCVLFVVIVMVHHPL